MNTVWGRQENFPSYISKRVLHRDKIPRNVLFYSIYSSISSFLKGIPAIACMFEQVIENNHKVYKHFILNIVCISGEPYSLRQIQKVYEWELMSSIHFFVRNIRYTSKQIEYISCIVKVCLLIHPVFTFIFIKLFIYLFIIDNLSSFISISSSFIDLFFIDHLSIYHWSFIIIYNSLSLIISILSTIIIYHIILFQESLGHTNPVTT